MDRGSEMDLGVEKNVPTLRCRNIEQLFISGVMERVSSGYWTSSAKSRARGRGGGSRERWKQTRQDREGE